MVNIEPHLYQIKLQQVYLHRITAEFVIDLCVFDAVVDGLEILSGNFTTENTEGTE